MWQALIAPILGIGEKFIDKAVEDKDERNRLKAEFARSVHEAGQSELEGSIKIILAEASGSWLQRNWRPMMMVWFAALVGAHWFGFTPDNLSQDAINMLFEIVKIGIGGYIVGRSAEKIASSWVETKK